MNENDSNRDATEPEIEPGPSDKLDDKDRDSSLIPGAQNPDNEAIKNEVNPNTE
jgi:hypothetical protein